MKKATNRFLSPSFFPYYLILGFRLIVPFFLWTYPFLTTLASFLLDCIDFEVYRMGFIKSQGGKYSPFSLKLVDQKAYQWFDKSLDYYWYLIALIYSLRLPIFNLLLVLFIWRNIGMIIFLVKRDKRVFFFFPNVFENVFIFYILATNVPFLSFLAGKKYFPSVLITLSVFKISQEYFVHLSGHAGTYKHYLYHLFTKKKVK